MKRVKIFYCLLIIFTCSYSYAELGPGEDGFIFIDFINDNDIPPEESKSLSQKIYNELKYFNFENEKHKIRFINQKYDFAEKDIFQIFESISNSKNESRIYYIITGNLKKIDEIHREIIIKFLRITIKENIPSKFDYLDQKKLKKTDRFKNMAVSQYSTHSDNSKDIVKSVFNNIVLFFNNIDALPDFWKEMRLF